MFECVSLAILYGLVAYWEWKGGLHGLYGAVHLMMRPRPAVAAGPAPAESARHRDDELKRQIWRQAASALTRDTSPMEIRMTGSLKSIREQAEQGLVAADAEKARHLAAIWSMAACDLDDDLDQVAH